MSDEVNAQIEDNSSNYIDIVTVVGSKSVNVLVKLQEETTEAENVVYYMQFPEVKCVDLVVKSPIATQSYDQKRASNDEWCDPIYENLSSERNFMKVRTLRISYRLDKILYILIKTNQRNTVKEVSSLDHNPTKFPEGLISRN